MARLRKPNPNCPNSPTPLRPADLGPPGPPPPGPKIAECSETVGCSGSARCYDPASTWSCPPASASESALPFDLVHAVALKRQRNRPRRTASKAATAAPVMSRMMTPSVSLDRLGHISH